MHQPNIFVIYRCLDKSSFKIPKKIREYSRATKCNNIASISKDKRMIYCTASDKLRLIYVIFKQKHKRDDASSRLSQVQPITALSTAKRVKHRW